MCEYTKENVPINRGTNVPINQCANVLVCKNANVQMKEGERLTCRSEEICTSAHFHTIVVRGKTTLVKKTLPMHWKWG